LQSLEFIGNGFTHNVRPNRRESYSADTTPAISCGACCVLT
jgi:hypothetical protein